MFVRTIKRSENTNSLAIMISTLVILMAISVTITRANPLNLENGYLNRKQSIPLTVEITEPEELINSLESLLQQILQGMDYTRQLAFIQQKGNDKKRGIDLGLSRGFSGSQAAKHLMGMQAASFANGPGKRK